MQSVEGTVKVVREWVDKAENDLFTAAFLLKSNDRRSADTICFPAQQCAEKYLKAALIWRGIEFPRTHNIALLISFSKLRFIPPLTKIDQDRLTEYAAVTRYPGDYEPASLTEARRAVSLARRVKRGVLKLLPGSAHGAG